MPQTEMFFQQHPRRKQSFKMETLQISSENSTEDAIDSLLGQLYLWSLTQLVQSVPSAANLRLLFDHLLLCPKPAPLRRPLKCHPQRSLVLHRLYRAGEEV